MKAFFALTSLVLFVTSCALKPAPQKHEEPPRKPASVESKGLSDQYGDTLVIFCSPQEAVVYIDPNKCGEALAKGAPGCTKLASYSSAPLKVDQQNPHSDLITPEGDVLFTLNPLKDGVELTSSLPFAQKKKNLHWKELSERQRTAGIQLCSPE